ncbi:glycosyltransferase [Lichenifustis flavocetrariae]|uniref:Glycosyltransferase n=1 Tax=Lichenifustis flavocetrariae TaxID=2949735 RepID=A0AA41Z7W1_9HYPH|nr:glycosyltransferase [Lichenifustis flavocetrariae]MCW6511935.1 glycosyltransferase [Lichenifustis flavocetrariae]
MRFRDFGLLRKSLRKVRSILAARYKSQAGFDFAGLQASTSPDAFDPIWYLHRYPDTADFHQGPFAHFCLHGAKEVRHPSPHIDLSSLYRSRPNLHKSDPDLLLKAIEDNLGETARPHLPSDEYSFEYLLFKYKLFDAEWYLARNRDVASSGLSPIKHFVRHGSYENRDPSPAFDSEFYRAVHPEYVEDSLTAVEYFVRIGARRGHVGIGAPALERWLEAFDTLTPRDIKRIAADRSLSHHAVLVLHIIDVDAVACFDRIFAAWAAQIGVNCRICFVRGSTVPDDVWNRCTFRVDGHEGMSTATSPNEAIGFSPTTTLIFCAGAQIMRPHMAYMLALTLDQSGADAVYADHDHIAEDGRRSAPAFKPAMSPDFMRSTPYAGNTIGTIFYDRDRKLYEAILGRAMLGHAEITWAAHLLQIAPSKVAHAPFILSHDCLIGSCGTDHGHGLSVVPMERDRHDNLADVTIIIPTRDHCNLLRECIDSIQSDTDYPSQQVTIVVVDNGSTQAATIAYFAELRSNPGVLIVPSPGPFNFAKLCNVGAFHAKGDVVVFLNNDTTVLRRHWLQALVKQALKPDVGVVGAHLLYPDGTTQHGGVVLGVQGVGAHRLKPAAVGPAGQIDLPREMVAVTGACLALRRRLFETLGGFDPVLKVAFNDVKLCASAYEAGYRNIYMGEPLLYHHESKSRGFDVTRDQQHRNAREAMYVRDRFGPLFQNDPTYSPNLSLQEVDKLATPPRAIRPWRRRSPSERWRVLLLCYQHGLGHGVAIVLEQQALFLRERGWDVVVGGPKRSRDLAYKGCERVSLWTPEAAAAYATSEGIHCIIAHTPPFFSITRYLGAEPLVYFMDHGEPPAQLFPDREAREDIDWEKRFCACLARRVFVISRAIQDAQHRPDTMLIRNGNSHLSSWSERWAGQRDSLRRKYGFDDCFVILNVCRFRSAERIYKGVVRYGNVASDLPYFYPDIGEKVRFILAGRGDDDDVAAVQAMGLDVYPNVSDAELIELYAASDLYMNFSEWEGYNLGIGQALAMGLDVVASDIAAHREFDIEVSDSILKICASIKKRQAAQDDAQKTRHSKLDMWKTSLGTLAQTIEADLQASERQRASAPHREQRSARGD